MTFTFRGIYLRDILSQEYFSYINFDNDIISSENITFQDQLDILNGTKFISKNIVDYYSIQDLNTYLESDIYNDQTRLSTYAMHLFNQSLIESKYFIPFKNIVIIIIDVVLIILVFLIIITYRNRVNEKFSFDTFFEVT